MSERNKQEITLYDGVTPVAVASSTDATPIVVTTSTNHGFNTGDRVLVYGHTTNIAANGIRKVIVLSPTTFSLQGEFSGTNVVGSGAGAGSGGIAVKAPPILLTQDFVNIELQLDTANSASLTLQAVISEGKPASAQTSPRYDFMDFGETQAPSNPWGFIQLVDVSTNLPLDGATGIVLTGTDFHKNYEVNGNLQKYFTVIPTAWTVGAITLKAILSSI